MSDIFFCLLHIAWFSIHVYTEIYNMNVLYYYVYVYDDGRRFTARAPVI